MSKHAKKKKKETAQELAFVLPPHINAKVHEEIMADIKKMSHEEFFAFAVECGIFTADGELTEPYQAEPIMRTFMSGKLPD